jgi:hypothetical protein
MRHILVAFLIITIPLGKSLGLPFDVQLIERMRHDPGSDTCNRRIPQCGIELVAVDASSLLVLIVQWGARRGFASFVFWFFPVTS